MSLSRLVQSVGSRARGVHLQHLEYDEASAPAVESGEMEWARDMIPSRRAQFAAGRWCARASLGQIGLPPCVIPADSTGVPIWPDGVTGSISHKEGASVAAIAFPGTAGMLGVGVDLELDEPRDELAVADRVLTPDESVRLNDLARQTWAPASPATLVMCAKEAVFKAVFASDRIDFDWQDFEVCFDRSSRTFSVVWLTAAPRGSVHGTFEVGHPWLLALAVRTQ